MEKIGSIVKTAMLDIILKYVEKETGESFVKEYRFYPSRRWRFDVAFPKVKVAVEIEGGVWQYGRHNRAASFLADMEKYNAAAMEGWCVLRYTWEDVMRGDPQRDLKDAIKRRQHKVSYSYL